MKSEASFSSLTNVCHIPPFLQDVSMDLCMWVSKYTLMLRYTHQHGSLLTTRRSHPELQAPEKHQEKWMLKAKIYNAFHIFHCSAVKAAKCGSQ